MTDRESQNKKVLKHLVSGRRITSYQAIKLYGITRLASRINDLKRSDVPIKTKIRYHRDNKSIHWAEYSLKGGSK